MPASSMILDVMVLEGKRADSTLCETLVERHTKTFGRPPRRAAFNGGFASSQNLKALKDIADWTASKPTSTAQSWQRTS